MRTLFINVTDYDGRLIKTVALSVEKNHKLSQLNEVVSNLARIAEETEGTLNYNFSEDVPEALKPYVASDVDYAIQQNTDDVVYRSFRFYGSALDFYYSSIEKESAAEPEDKDKETTFTP